jgi:hypothetical protein
MEKRGMSAHDRIENISHITKDGLERIGQIRKDEDGTYSAVLDSGTELCPDDCSEEEWGNVGTGLTREQAIDRLEECLRDEGEAQGK